MAMDTVVPSPSFLPVPYTLTTSSILACLATKLFQTLVRISIGKFMFEFGVDFFVGRCILTGLLHDN